MNLAIVKPLINTTEVCKLLPGKGESIFRKFLAARWLSPVRPAARPFYRTSDVHDCLKRLEKGEEPMAVHVWRAGMGLEGSRAVAHLVPAGGTKAVCGFKAEFMSAGHANTQCTRCMSHAKVLRVEDA